MVGAPARVYTCEVSQPHLRGMLGAMASVGVSTGVLIQVSTIIVIKYNLIRRTYYIYLLTTNLFVFREYVYFFSQRLI